MPMTITEKSLPPTPVGRVVPGELINARVDLVLGMISPRRLPSKAQ